MSEKVITYGFGIVVLEIVGGRRCTNSKTEAVSCSLLEHLRISYITLLLFACEDFQSNSTFYRILQTWDLFKHDAYLNLVDKTLDPDEYVIDNIKKIVEIGLMCTQSPSSARPTMSEVVGLLTSDLPIKGNPPGKPIFF